MRGDEPLALALDGLRERIEVEVGHCLVVRLLRGDEFLEQRFELGARGQLRRLDGPRRLRQIARARQR